MEKLYSVYNDRAYVHPDPLETIYQFDDLGDREIAGLIAACLAYGRVRQILKSVSFALEAITPKPFDQIKAASPKSLKKHFANFKHRFADGENISSLILGIKGVVAKHGSLYHCFLNGLKPKDETVIPALDFFVKELTKNGGADAGHLIPWPEKGSACKRLNLFLRWMVRKDRVDPGGWAEIPTSMLVIPLDTHMHRISIAMGLTHRRQASMRTALEITAAFKTISPDDPVKYDFALTRLGIRDGNDPTDIRARNYLK